MDSVKWSVPKPKNLNKYTDTSTTAPLFLYIFIVFVARTFWSNTFPNSATVCRYTREIQFTDKW